MTTIEEPRVVCVLGMHRGGTSLVANALEAIGVSLGPPARRMKLRGDNPEGFGEHQGLTDVSEEILTRLGGRWDRPPSFPAEWVETPAIMAVGARVARLLTEDFGATRLWGWKDPRACLTLPFWQRVMPPLRFVIVVRSPIEVARSLKARDGLSLETSVDLWLRYMHGALAHSAGSPRLFLAYEDLVERAEAEAARLSAFVHEGDAPSGSVERAASVVRADLRHHRTEAAEVAGDGDIGLGARGVFIGLRLMAAVDRDRAPRSDLAAAVTSLAAEARKERPGSADPRLLDQLVDLKWVAQRAVDETERLRRELAARDAAPR